MINKTKQILKSGNTAYGMFVTTPSTEDVEICGASGFDFVIIDMEHGAIDFETCRHLICAAERRGLTPIVRVPLTMRQSICLDWGAEGILIPMVRTSKEVSDCIKKLKYYPSGDRGIWLGRAANYCIDIDKPAYFAEQNDQTMICVQIETKDAADSIEQILDENPEIDLAFIGPTDLSQSMGFPACYENAQVMARVEECITRIKERGVKVGIFTNDPDTAERYRGLGVDFIAGDMISFVGSKIYEFNRLLRGEKA